MAITTLRPCLGTTLPHISCGQWRIIHYWLSPEVVICLNQLFVLGRDLFMSCCWQKKIGYSSHKPMDGWMSRWLPWTVFVPFHPMPITRIVSGVWWKGQLTTLFIPFHSKSVHVVLEPFSLPIQGFRSLPSSQVNSISFSQTNRRGRVSALNLKCRHPSYTSRVFLGGSSWILLLGLSVWSVTV